MSTNATNVGLVNNPFVPPAGCPVNDLPIELLAHIFYLGTVLDEWNNEEDQDEVKQTFDNLAEWVDLDVDEECEDDEDGSRCSSLPDFEPGQYLPFQVLVSHVCRLWREVAIGSPILWTYLDFLEGPPFEKSRTWIERSATNPLDIDIDGTESDDAQDDDTPIIRSTEDVSAILDIIQPHVQRWRRFIFRVDAYEHIHLLLSRLSECEAAPQLELLELWHHGACDATEDSFRPANLRQFFVPFHGVAPKLQSVVLWGVHLKWSCPILSNLTELDLAYHALDVRPSWEDFSRILRESPHLESLSLCMSGPELSSEPAEPIELTELRKLELSYHEAEYLSPLVKTLDMPKLEHLVLDLESSDYSSFVSQLSTPPPGKSKSLLSGLEHLKIVSLACDDKTIGRMYEQLTNLKSITLACTFLDEVFFRKLMKPIPSPPSSGSSSVGTPPLYCPNLESVRTTGIDGKLMREFVATRKAAGFPIKHLEMSEDDEVAEKDDKWLEQNVEKFSYFEPSDEEDEEEYDDDLDGSDVEDDVGADIGVSDIEYDDDDDDDEGMVVDQWLGFA